MHMVKPVTYELRIRPLCLPIAPELKQRFFDNSSATIVGWGGGRRKRDVVTRQKKWNKIFCPHYTRRGDSGGAMVKQLDNNPRKIKAYYAIGILSGFEGKNSRFFSVTGYLEWIKDVITSYPEGLY